MQVGDLVCMAASCVQSVYKKLTWAARPQAGDHVRVAGGQHEGQTGMVVRVEGAACVLVSDAAKSELRVFARDLSEAAAGCLWLRDVRLPDAELH